MRQESLENFFLRRGFDSRHLHHIELAASLGASPIASADRFARKLKGFLKSISSCPAARRRFEPIFLRTGYLLNSPAPAPPAQRVGDTKELH